MRPEIQVALGNFLIRVPLLFDKIDAGKLQVQTEIADTVYLCYAERRTQGQYRIHNNYAGHEIHLNVSATRGFLSKQMAKHAPDESRAFIYSSIAGAGGSPVCLLATYAATACFDYCDIAGTIENAPFANYYHQLSNVSQNEENEALVADLLRRTFTRKEIDTLHRDRKFQMNFRPFRIGYAGDLQQDVFKYPQPIFTGDSDKDRVLGQLGEDQFTLDPIGATASHVASGVILEQVWRFSDNLSIRESIYASP